LILSGKVGDKFHINEDIEIIIVSSKNGIIRLGFEAPREIPIHRSKVYEEIKRIKAGQTEPSA